MILSYWYWNYKVLPNHRQLPATKMRMPDPRAHAILYARSSSWMRLHLQTRKRFSSQIRRRRGSNPVKDGTATFATSDNNHAEFDIDISKMSHYITWWRHMMSHTQWVISIALPMMTGAAINQIENRLWWAPTAKQSIPVVCNNDVHLLGKSAIARTVTQIWIHSH